MSFSDVVFRCSADDPESRLSLSLSLSLSFSVSLCGGGGGKEKRLRKEGTTSSKPRKETELRYGTFLSEFGVSFIIGRF